MNSRPVSLLFLSLLLLSILPSLASAADCNGTQESKLLIYNPRPYNDIGSSFTFKAFYQAKNGTSITENGTLVTVTFQNATYNMTYVAGEANWQITITSNQSEDVPLDINASSTTFQCKHTSFTTRFRIPFYVNFQLYKETLNSSDPARYMNDFQYVVLVNNLDNNNLDMTSLAFTNGVTNLVDSLTSWAMTNPGQKVSLAPPDKFTYFWGAYSNGNAKVKLYEPGNYSVYVMNNKVQYPSNVFWEFQRPTTNDPGYLGNVYKNLAVYNVTNISSTPTDFNNSVIKVSLSRFEANAYFATLNLFYIILIIIVYLALGALIIYICVQTGSGGQVIVAYFVGGGAIALGLIYAIPH